jgi:hypothetical protein
MVARFPTLGDVMEDTAAESDFTVRGEVKTAPGKGTAVRVEIQWIVTDAQSRESGRVVQINEVPAGTLDHYWGEVAEVVASEAAGGVHEVVVQASGRGTATATAKPGGNPAPDKPNQGVAPAKPGDAAAPAKPTG